jgi:hypothetical protein
MGSVVVEVVHFGEGVNEDVNEVATLDLPVVGLGDLADARPAVFAGTEEVLDAVDIRGLI